jgi:hypothetical protein
VDMDLLVVAILIPMRRSGVATAVNLRLAVPAVICPLVLPVVEYGQEVVVLPVVETLLSPPPAVMALTVVSFSTGSNIHKGEQCNMP